MNSKNLKMKLLHDNSRIFSHITFLNHLCKFFLICNLQSKITPFVLSSVLLCIAFN